MGGQRRLVAGLIILSLGLTPSGVWALQAHNVQVDYTPPQITLRVIGPADLRTVLAAICKQTKTRCVVMGDGGKAVVAPMTAKGTLFEVVAGVLAAMKVHTYSLVVASTSGKQPQLLVEVRSYTAAQPSSAPRKGALTGPAGAATPQNPLASSGQPPPATTATSTPPAPTTLSGPGPAGLGNQRVQPIDELKLSPDQIRRSLESVRMLYEGLSGINQVPGPLPTTFTLPFPDANGNSITVLVNNQPTAVLPWPDPYGRPIVIQPGAQSEKLEYPIPPYPPVK